MFDAKQIQKDLDDRDDYYGQGRAQNCFMCGMPEGGPHRDFCSQDRSAPPSASQTVGGANERRVMSENDAKEDLGQLLKWIEQGGFMSAELLKKLDEFDFQLRQLRAEIHRQAREYQSILAALDKAREKRGNK